jgi:acetyl esterase
MVGRVYLERGERVTVLARWGGDGPRNVLVERADGTRVVRPFRGLRRPAERSAQVDRASSSIAAE